MKKQATVSIPVLIVIAVMSSHHPKQKKVTAKENAPIQAATSTDKTTPAPKPLATQAVVKISPEVEAKVEASRPPLETVSNLSQKVFLSDDDKKAMAAALLKKETLQRISEGLNGPDLLKASEFKNRMKLIDAVYEGLKSQDPQVHTTYMKVTAQILGKEMTPQISGDKKMREQFLGDRVEVALAISKLPGFAANQLWIQTHSPSSQKYFKRAVEISGLYEVSL